MCPPETNSDSIIEAKINVHKHLNNAIPIVQADILCFLLSS